MSEQRLEVVAAVTEQAVERDTAGRYVAAARANDGFTWCVDITAAVLAAAAHHRDDEVARLKDENERLQQWLHWYAECYGLPDC